MRCWRKVLLPRIQEHAWGRNGDEWVQLSVRNIWRILLRMPDRQSAHIGKSAVIYAILVFCRRWCATRGYGFGHDVLRANIYQWIVDICYIFRSTSTKSTLQITKEACKLTEGNDITQGMTSSIHRAANTIYDGIMKYEHPISKTLQPLQNLKIRGGNDCL